MFCKVVAVCAFFGLVTATTFKDCGSNAGTISSVAVSNCPDGTIPCPFKKGTNVTLNVDVTPSIAADKLTMNLYGIIAGIKTPFQNNIDACANKLIECPTKSGTKMTFTDTVFVQKAYPKLRLVVDVELTTDDGKFILCVQVPAEITD